MSKWIDLNDRKPKNKQVVLILYPEGAKKVFEAEINGDVFQTKSKVAFRLEDAGYIQKSSEYITRDRFGEVIKTGYVTTLLGNMVYCASCANVVED